MAAAIVACRISPNLIKTGRRQSLLASPPGSGVKLAMHQNRIIVNVCGEVAEALASTLQSPPDARLARL
jgi:hypothetical protein